MWRNAEFGVSGGCPVLYEMKIKARHGKSSVNYLKWIRDGSEMIFAIISGGNVSTWRCNYGALTNGIVQFMVSSLGKC